MKIRTYEVEFATGNDLPVTDRPFSQAVCVGNLLLISGQASVSESGKIVSGSFEEEMERAIRNLDMVLNHFGISRSDVVQTRNYVDSSEDLAKFNTLYARYFPPPFPSRTTLINCLGGLLKYEIDAVAVVGEKRNIANAI